MKFIKDHGYSSNHLIRKCFTKFTMTLIIFLTILVFGQSQKVLQHQDCDAAFPVCAIKTYHFENLEGRGKLSDPLFTESYSPNNIQETNVLWMKWKALTDGNLTFVINPIHQEDDLDFILYKKISGECNRLEVLRYMVAGLNISDESNANQGICSGPTGLALTSTDTYEPIGCRKESDSFLKMLEMEKDVEYIMMVNNFNSANGFSITFEGESSLLNFDDCKLTEKDDQFFELNIYPSPATDHINFDFTTYKTASIDLDLLDITGKILHHKSFIPTPDQNKGYFDLTDMSSGTYLVRLKQGSIATTKQFVKK